MGVHRFGHCLTFEVRRSLQRGAWAAGHMIGLGKRWTSRRDIRRRRRIEPKWRNV